jgi:hypothetical protein
MGLGAWWSTLSHAYRFAIAVLLFDLLLLFGAVFSVLPLQATWEAVTGSIPNIYDGIAVQLVALIRDAAPGAVVIGGVALDFLTTFLSLISVHGVVAFGLGFLFDYGGSSRLWTFLGYGCVILVLFVIHFSLLLASAF